MSRAVLDYPSLPRIVTVEPSIPSDRVATLLTQLATPEFGAILTSVEDRLPVPEASLVERVVNEAAALALAGKPEEAAARVKSLIREFPRAAEFVPLDPKLAAAHEAVGRAVRSLTAETRHSAEQMFTRAAETLPSAPASIGGVAPWMILAVAERLTESTRLPDLVRARALAELAIRQPATHPRANPREVIERVRQAAKHVWRRAPLLVLLLSWLAAGLCGALGTEWWPVGLLGLVGLSFYARIRRVF